MAGEVWAPDIMKTDDGTVVGFSIRVALGSDENEREVQKDGKTYHVETMHVLNLVMNEKGFQYVLKSFDCYHLPNVSWIEDNYENTTYKKMNLEDVDKTILHRSL